MMPYLMCVLGRLSLLRTVQFGESDDDGTAIIAREIGRVKTEIDMRESHFKYFGVCRVAIIK